MAVNYKRRKSTISNRNWSNYSEKDNAKYMTKQLKDLGYKVPAYMKKGKINEQQIITYLDRIEKRLDREVEKQRLSKMSPAEKRREKRDTIQKDIDNYNNFVNNELTKGIPEELKSSEAFMNYMTKGEYITNRFRGYDLNALGYDVLNINNLEDLQNLTNTKSNKKLKSFMKNELENVKMMTYENQVNMYINNIEKELERRNTVDDKGQLKLSYKMFNTVKDTLYGLNLLQLMELSNQISRKGSVYDSIAGEDETNSDKALNVILTGLTGVGTSKGGYCFRIEDYGN